MLSDLRKIVSQSVIYGIGTMAPKLAGLILIPLYTKYFPLREFGIIGILDSTSQILIGIVGLALYQGFFRWYFDKEVEPKRKSLFYTLLIVHLILAILSIILIWPFASRLSVLFFHHSDYSYVIRVMAFASLLQMVVIMPSTLMRVQEKAGLYTYGNVVQMVIMVAATIYFIVFRKQGVEAIYHAQLIGLLVYLLFLSRYILRNCEFKFELYLLKEIFIFCLPLVLSSIAIVFLNQADRYIINHFGHLTDVGLYTMAFRISNTLNILLVASISFAIQPMIFKKMDDPNNKRFYSKLMTYFVFVLMLFVLSLSFFGKEVIKLFSKREEYFDAYKIIPLLSFAIIFNLMKDLALVGLQIVKKTKIIAWIILLVSISGILMNFLLVPVMQNYGAALARLLASLLFFVLIYYYSQRSYSIPYEIKKVFMMIIIGAILTVPVIYINDFRLSFRILTKLLLLSSYPFLLYAFGFFEEIELVTLKSAIIKWRKPADFFKNLKSLFK